MGPLILTGILKSLDDTNNQEAGIAGRIYGSISTVIKICNAEHVLDEGIVYCTEM